MACLPPDSSAHAEPEKAHREDVGRARARGGVWVSPRRLRLEMWRRADAARAGKGAFRVAAAVPERPIPCSMVIMLR